MAEEVNSSAQNCFDQLEDYLGTGLAGMINILDLPLIIVGGGLAGAWSLFSSAMSDAVQHYGIVYRLGAPGERELMESNRMLFVPPS
jgi:predicted NBD/HSP70 family sugar kinase